MSDQSSLTSRKGLIAVLDALGASTYSQEEIERFLRSRELVLESLKQVVAEAERGEGKKMFDAKNIKIFTFNDTVVIVYLVRGPISLGDVEDFCPGTLAR